MEFHQLLADAGHRLNLVISGLDANAGAMQITLGERLITVEPQSERGVVSISALLCFFPDQDKLGALCELLLEAHAFGILTDEANFAINRASSQILLFRNLPQATLDGEQLADALRRFVAVLDLWKEAYASGRLFQGVASVAIPDHVQAMPARFA